MPLLLEAIRYSNVPLIEACIQHNASLSQSIHYAVGAEKCFEILQILVDAGADVRELNEYGIGPLIRVGGTSLPGEEGEHNRKLKKMLIELVCCGIVYSAVEPTYIPSATKRNFPTYQLSTF